jgi:hypothetical protein
MDGRIQITGVQSEISALPPTLEARLVANAATSSWTPITPEMEMEEYRRFLMLLASSGQALTPSRSVEAVWNVHLELTPEEAVQRWRRTFLPPLVAGEPESGYLRTLDLYTQMFGPPPDLIWPDPRRPTNQIPTPRWFRSISSTGTGRRVSAWADVLGPPLWVGCLSAVMLTSVLGPLLGRAMVGPILVIGFLVGMGVGWDLHEQAGPTLPRQIGGSLTLFLASGAVDHPPR